MPFADHIVGGTLETRRPDHHPTASARHPRVGERLAHDLRANAARVAQRDGETGQRHMRMET
jgi:hypothetical protein